MLQKTEVQYREKSIIKESINLSQVKWGKKKPTNSVPNGCYWSEKLWWLYRNWNGRIALFLPTQERFIPHEHDNKLILKNKAKNFYCECLHLLL